MPGTITLDDLRAALGVVLAPVLEELQAQRAQSEALQAEVTALRAQLAQLPSSQSDLVPVLASLDDQRESGQALQGEVSSLRGEVAVLTAELHAARATVERLEVMTHAALPGTTPAQAPAALGVWGVLARALGLHRRD
ncbi:hypothetical protein [Deinococcus peraridilitoris]|uniref:hypothetical protein n=1 Tax=Deinococcus peraridilitoris TaxID=432329 RepID=UPI0002D96F6F|nr:hypothetical protein [Deinococcus peraridilitoris]